MPLRSGPIASDGLLPWLANMLPETHLARISKRLKVWTRRNPENDVPGF
ncbi:hypothetical protein ACLE20_11615 [Rhizobium sp. YIM 134829]